MLRALAASLLALLLVAPSAGADVALLDDVRAADVALAGRDVLVAREGRDGRVTLDAVNLDGAPRRRVLTVRSPGREWIAQTLLSASAERVALLVLLTDDEGNLREWRVYSGPPAGPVTLALRVPRIPEPEWAPIGIDVDGDRLLLSELRARDSAARARVLVPGAAPWTVPWPGWALTPAAIAGERVAFLASTRPGRRARLDRVFVADWHTGAVAAILDIDDPDTLDREGNGMDLAPDGRVVATSSSRLLTVAPGVPQAAIPGAARRSLPRFAGARIVALEAGRFDARGPVAIDAGGRSTRLGARSIALERIAADERGAAWIANGCVRYAPLDGSTPAAMPAGCPSGEVLLEDHDQTLRGRTFRIAVTCIAAAPPGCRGTALLRAGGVRARGRFAVPVGAKRLVTVRLTRRGLRWARASLRRHGEAVMRLAARMPDGRFPADRHGSSVFLTVDPELRG